MLDSLFAHAGEALAHVRAWSAANPELTAIIVVSLTAALFKPKTPDQYAKIAAFSPRLAAFLQLLGALGIDTAKAAKVATKLATGKSDPPPPAISLLKHDDCGTECEDSHREAIRGAGAMSGIVRAAMKSGAVAIAMLGLVAVTSCTPDARRALLDQALDTTQCALANMNLSNEQIVIKCAIQTGDIDRILRIVGEARQAAATQAMQAELRGFLAGEEAGRAAGSSADAGACPPNARPEQW